MTDDLCDRITRKSSSSVLLTLCCIRFLALATTEVARQFLKADDMTQSRILVSILIRSLYLLTRWRPFSLTIALLHKLKVCKRKSNKVYPFEPQKSAFLKIFQKSCKELNSSHPFHPIFIPSTSYGKLSFECLVSKKMPCKGMKQFFFLRILKMN